MSSSEPILSEFLTKEDLAAELRLNPRTLDCWQVLGIGPQRTLIANNAAWQKSRERAA
jgi:hypothetical protein